MKNKPDKTVWPFSQEELESALEIIWDGHGACHTADKHILDSIEKYNINQSPQIHFATFSVGEGIICQFCPLRAAEMLGDGSKCITSEGALNHIEEWKRNRIFNIL